MVTTKTAHFLVDLAIVLVFSAVAFYAGWRARTWWADRAAE